MQYFRERSSKAEGMVDDILSNTPRKEVVTGRMNFAFRRILLERRYALQDDGTMSKLPLSEIRNLRYPAIYYNVQAGTDVTTGVRSAGKPWNYRGLSQSAVPKNQLF